MTNDKHTNGTRSFSTGPLEGRFLSDLERAGVSVFSLRRHRELFRELSDPRLRTLLHELGKKGWLIPIERGKYLVVPRAARRTWHEHPFVIAAGLAPSDYYISYWSALSFHNLTEQLPRVVYVALAEERRRPVVFQGWEYNFIHLAKDKFYGFKGEEFPALNGAATVEVQVADPEKAIIDSVDRESLAGGFAEVVRSIRRGLEGGTLSVDRLLGYASEYPNAAAATRVGYVLSRLGIEESRQLRGKLHQHGYPVYLSQAAPKDGALFDSQWGMWTNVPEDLFSIQEAS